jgi:hypothetical protein
LPHRARRGLRGTGALGLLRPRAALDLGQPLAAQLAPLRLVRRGGDLLLPGVALLGREVARPVALRR